MTAEIIRLDVVRAMRALDRFRSNEDRGIAVDKLYGPAERGLGMADIDAMRELGLATVRRRSGRGPSFEVSLTPLGRRERDKKRESRKAR